MSPPQPAFAHWRQTRFTTWRSSMLFLAGGAIASTALSFGLGNAWLTPFFGAAIAYAVFLPHIWRQQYGRVTGLMLLWALWQSLAVGGATLLFPNRAAAVILSGPTYVDEMLLWIQTGEGAEGSLRLFLPIHIRNYLIFCGLCCLTVSSTALLFGTWLLNYMNFYVATLIRASVHPGLTMLVGWPPWSLLRVIGFILTGIALAVVGLNLWASILGRSRQPAPPRAVPLNYLKFGVGFVVADIIVKTVVAPYWRQLLHFTRFGEFI